MPNSIKINRAPVLTLWAAVVAERLGFDRPTALTLGQAVAGLSAYAKGVSLSIIEPKPDLVREQGERLAKGQQLHVDLLGRAVPIVRTPDGLRAVSKGKTGKPDRIETYLAGKFGGWRPGGEPGSVAYEPADLYRRGFKLYEMFRPGVPAGESGWGAKGELDLDKVRSMAGKAQG